MVKANLASFISTQAPRDSAYVANLKALNGVWHTMCAQGLSDQSGGGFWWTSLWGQSWILWKAEQDNYLGCRTIPMLMFICLLISLVDQYIINLVPPKVVGCSYQNMYVLIKWWRKSMRFGHRESGKIYPGAKLVHRTVTWEHLSPRFLGSKKSLSWVIHKICNICNLSISASPNAVEIGGERHCSGRHCCLFGVTFSPAP